MESDGSGEIIVFTPRGAERKSITPALAREVAEEAMKFAGVGNPSADELSILPEDQGIATS